MKDSPAPASSYKAILRKVLPDSILKERGIYLRLGRRAGNSYVRLRFMDAIGWKGASLAVPRTSRSFLFVCFGNIMRSPVAEALFRQELTQRGVTEPVQIASAGLHATPGNMAHAWAVAASADFNISLESHRAQLITLEMVQAADVIFAMDFQNKAELLTRFPESSHKIFMLTSCLHGRGQHREIFDPYFGDVESTRACYRVIQSCAQSLADVLFPAVPDKK